MFSNNKIVWIAAILMWGNSFCSNNDDNKIINVLSLLQQKGIVPLDPCRTCHGRNISFTSMRSHCKRIHGTKLHLQLFDRNGEYVYQGHQRKRDRMQPFLKAAKCSDASEKFVYFQDQTSDICALDGHDFAIEIATKSCKGKALKRLQDQSAQNAQLRLLRKMVKRFDQNTLDQVAYVSRNQAEHIKGLISLNNILGTEMGQLPKTMERIIGYRSLNKLRRGIDTRISAVKAKNDH